MNKLLEAIQKGVQMGLEIQDDELDQSTFQGSKITSDYYLDRSNHFKWLRENFVDLGLPSGTLWCKWNIGATNGDTKESWYGDYYAWGEVNKKEKSSWDNYKYSSHDGMLKYTKIDSKITLDREDDVVSVIMGEDFKMPTVDDFEELGSLPNEWVKDYNGINGLNGRVFTGNNGKQLFIPAAGFHSRSRIQGDGSFCHLWSSSLHFPYISYAYDLCCRVDGISPLDSRERCMGHTVRGVLKHN